MLVFGHVIVTGVGASLVFALEGRPGNQAPNSSPLQGFPLGDALPRVTPWAALGRPFGAGPPRHGRLPFGLAP